MREREGEMASMSTHNMRNLCKEERQWLCCMYMYICSDQSPVDPFWHPSCDT